MLMNARTCVVVVSLLAGEACGGALTEAGAKVKLMKADPPQSCTEVGSAAGTQLEETTKNV
jgi:hypothetical protein